MSEVSAETCYNLSYFKDLMKEFRKIDDNIMLKMNTTDTHSKDACADFFKKLADAYQKREYVINKCLKILDAELEKKQKALDDDPFDSNLKNQMFVDESKRRMINNEFTVEDIVRERSLTVFKNKCRLFHIPKEFEDFINKRR
ncbi:caffeine-induced death protein 2 [Glomus cerebriforme]|uniref:Caffeine-induced death protein 2 n=1 Tax=Glomus cerebriforme TaxID=658196 RepID=A0A397T202_9GLOM|nr:caffeine-induced death protein 2 [Glomus cerebriforme]